MKNYRATMAALICGLAVSTAAAYGVSAPAMAADPCSAMDDPLHVLQHGSGGTTLVTPWTSEANQAVQAYGYSADVTLAASTRSVSGLTPIHRLYQSGDFFHVKDSEVSTWTNRGYRDEGVKFWAAATPQSCTVGMHTLAKGKDHKQLRATDVGKWTALGWTDLGTSFNAGASVSNMDEPPAPAPEPVPAPQHNPGDPDADGVFTIAVLPDVQGEVLKPSTTRLDQRNAWLVAHKGPEDLDLRAVLQVGDLTDWDTPDHQQYVTAQRGMSVLDGGGIPWVGAIGNHDSQATGVGGSARPGIDTNAALRDTTGYNRFFPPSTFDLLGGAETPGKEDNSYHTFSAGGANWMVISLELWPRTDKVAWAKRVISDHPQHNVILLTHHYLDPSGSIPSSNGGYGDNSPRYMYDQLVAPNPNVKMVFSGHTGLDQARTDSPGGHKVVSMAQNHDNTTDTLTRLVTIDVNKGTITHTYRSVTTARVQTPASTLTGFTFKK